jgi:RND family efflux transporter MFP subunit
MKSKKIFNSILLLTLGILGCGGSEEHGAEETPSASVSVQTVRSGQVDRRFVASGTLGGSQTAVLTSKAPGYVQEIRFKPGDRVRSGQVLFVLEDSELGAKLRAAEAGLEEARQGLTEAENGLKAAEAQARVATVTYERFKTLKEKRAVAPQEFDEVEGNYTAAVARKEMAEAALRRVQSSLVRAEAQVEAVKSYTQVTAPFSGQVTERRVDIGNLAVPGTPLGVIERAGGLRAEASVPESQAGRIQVGDEALVWFQDGGEPVKGRVSEVNQGVDVMTRAFMVQVDLPEDLTDIPGANPRPGMFVRVGFNVGQTESILIPEKALLQRGQLEMVYVVEDEHARTRLVTIGPRRGSQIEVLSGLSDGDVVVTDPGTNLREGVRVVTQ